MRALIKSLLIGAASCFTLTGCMQHNGNIGDWFGTWKLESLTIDGSEDPTYEENLFFQFQTDIVRIVEVSIHEPATRTECFGRWEENDRTLTLDFSYTADGTTHFIPLPSTMLADDVNLLYIDSQTSKRMQWTLERTDPPATIVYTLKKQ